MFCKFCGKEVSNNNRFCSNCGKELNPVAKQSTEGRRSSAFLFMPFLIIIGVAIVALLLVILLRLPDGTKPEIEVPEPEPVVTIVGDWEAADGIGITFTESGIMRFKSGNLSLGGDTFRYEVKDEDTLFLRGEDLFWNIGIDIPYMLNEDTLYIAIDDVTIMLTRK